MFPNVFLFMRRNGRCRGVFLYRGNTRRRHSTFLGGHEVKKKKLKAYKEKEDCKIKNPGKDIRLSRENIRMRFDS